MLIIDLTQRSLLLSKAAAHAILESKRGCASLSVASNWGPR